MKMKHASTVHSSARFKEKSSKTRLRFAMFTMLPLTFAVSSALANPDGGVVVGGQAAITQRPGVTIVDQTSNRAIINWNGFSIDPGELTKFNQPGIDAVALNRVIGNDPSQLLGALEANGHVWLVNPNGILFGPSARIDVHGLLATTADINNQDFLAGRNHFSIPSPNTGAAVINQGTISIGEHGLAALVAPHVRNAGIIQGKMGQVVIAGAPTFTLDFYGDGLIQFEATSKVTENTNPNEALVRNDGTISVDGGNVLITANAAAGIVDETINMDGIIEARSVGMENGVIVLNGGDNGLVRVAGSLDASGHDAGESGGTVKVLGEKVGLYAGTQIDASGDAGGGEVLIGGNFQGKGVEPNAKRTYVASAASIDADALTHGDGGRVIVWADEVTSFAGDISANGGINGGDGGFVEISGKQYLNFEGNVDLSASNGQPGSLLLDPENIIIVDGGEGSGANDNELDNNEILFGDSPGATFTISETALEAIAADANIILEATNDITVQNLFTDFTLNFQATTGSVTFRAGGFFRSFYDIETQGGSVEIEAGTIAGSSMDILTNGGSITLTSNSGIIDTGDIDASSAFSNGGDVTMNTFDSISTGSINSSGFLRGGNITLTSTTGVIATDFATEGPPLNPLNSSSVTGTAGNIVLTATSVDVGDINASSDTGQGGSISINSLGNIDTGSITFGAITALSGGPFTADAAGTISIAGLAPNGADINIGTVTRPGDLLLPATIDTNGGDVTLLVGNAYTFATDLTSDQGFFSLDGLQAITLAAPIQTDGGNITVQTAAGALTVDGPVSAGDVISGLATIELAAATDLILNNDVSAQSVVLRAGNVIAQSVETLINASNLGIAAAAAPALNVGTSDVVTLAAQITGAGNPFSFTDSNGLVIGQVGSLAGISTNNGDVTLDIEGDLTVDDPISTGSTIVLQATENIVINAPFDLLTQAADERVVLQAGDNITVNAAITTQAADLHIEANSPHQGFGANGFVGGITSNAPLATNGGDITLIGSGAIDMRAIFDAGDGTISHSPPGPFSIVVTDDANFLVNARTTGAIILGQVQSAGDDGLGTESEIFTASDIVFNSINLDPTAASEMYAIATNNVTFDGNFATGQALFVNADADEDGSGAISAVNGNITLGGPLQLRAGSGIDIDTTNLGSVAAFTSGGDIVVENTGGSSTVTTVSELSGLTARDGTITFITDGGLTVEQPIQAAGDDIDQSSILLSVMGGFVNEFTDAPGELALQPGTGRYMVYSIDPVQDTRGIPDDQFSKRYNFPFNPDDPLGVLAGLAADDNFFLYEISPTLTLVANDATRGFAEPDPEFTYTLAGLIDGDTVEIALDSLPVLTTSADLTSFPGDYLIEVDPELASTLGYTIERVPGTLVVTEGVFGDLQNPNLLLPNLPLEELLKPVVPLVLSEQPGPTFAVPDLPSLSDSSKLLSPNDGNRELWGTPR